MTTSESAAVIRTALTATFPATQFSIQPASSATPWVDVRWDGGPSSSEVRHAVQAVHPTMPAYHPWQEGVAYTRDGVPA